MRVKATPEGNLIISRTLEILRGDTHEIQRIEKTGIWRDFSSLVAKYASEVSISSGAPWSPDLGEKG